MKIFTIIITMKTILFNENQTVVILVSVNFSLIIIVIFRINIVFNKQFNNIYW